MNASLKILGKPLSYGLFGLFVLLVTPLSIFDHSSEHR